MIALIFESIWLLFEQIIVYHGVYVYLGEYSVVGGCEVDVGVHWSVWNSR